MKKLLSVKQAAEILGCHHQHLYRIMGARKIEYLDIPGVGKRFDPDVLMRFIQANKQEATEWSRNER